MNLNVLAGALIPHFRSRTGRDQGGRRAAGEQGGPPCGGRAGGGAPRVPCIFQPQCSTENLQGSWLYDLRLLTPHLSLSLPQLSNVSRAGNTSACFRGLLGKIKAKSLDQGLAMGGMAASVTHLASSAGSGCPDQDTVPCWAFGSQEVGTTQDPREDENAA